VPLKNGFMALLRLVLAQYNRAVVLKQNHLKFRAPVLHFLAHFTHHAHNYDRPNNVKVHEMKHAAVKGARARTHANNHDELIIAQSLLARARKGQ